LPFVSCCNFASTSSAGGQLEHPSEVNSSNTAKPFPSAFEDFFSTVLFSCPQAVSDKVVMITHVTSLGILIYLMIYLIFTLKTISKTQGRLGKTC
jgi:hypothetical protein